MRRKESFSFAFLSFIRNFAFTTRSYWHSEEKTNEFVLFFPRFSVTLPSKMANLLRLGKKMN